MLQTKSTSNITSFDQDDIAAAFAYIETQWPVLTREQRNDDGTLIGLPFPYVVPSVEAQGGFVFDEMYYWDSYFIAQGLLRTGHQELAEGMLENLLFMARKFHIIPNASRFYHTKCSQPPLLTSYIFDVYKTGDKSLNWLRERMAVAEKEYQTVWMGTAHPNNRLVHNGLSRYYEINMLDDLAETESGWDHTTRFYGECLSFIPVDLNSLLYKYERDLAECYRLLEDADTAEVWSSKAQVRASAMTETLWDEEAGFFFDYNYKDDQQSQIWSLANVYALWSGVATIDQAERIAHNIQKFIYDGGLATTLPTGENGARDIAHQWSYPNGWAPLHWLAVNGLQRYGYGDLAHTISRLWLGNNMQYFQRHGVFREAYNVVDTNAEPIAGVYPPQIGFGWTNGVFVDLAKTQLTATELQKV